MSCSAVCRPPGAARAYWLRWAGLVCYVFGVATVDDLRVLGAPVDNPVATARFINRLALRGAQKARLLRAFLRERRLRLTTDVLVAARDYSFFL